MFFDLWINKKFTAGAMPSNTAPRNYILGELKMEFRELFKGIDSMYVSFKGTLKEGLKEFLDEKKDLLSLIMKKNKH